MQGENVEIKTNSSGTAGYVMAYLFFTAAVAVYNYFFLPYGFNATDEGWLLSVASRIVDGQVPYRDFFFLKTPLTIYIQAALIGIFGDSYTVLASRIYWACQIWFMVVLASLFYRHYIKAIELLFLLFFSYILASLFIAFPWYNYDGAMFALAAAVLFYKKRPVLCGVAAGLAFLTKQNYLLLLPLFFGIVGLLKWRGVSILSVRRREVVRICLGFLAPVVLFILYLAVNGALTDFFKNIIILPASCSKKSIWFVLFQDNFSAIVYALPFMITAGILFFTRRYFWVIPLIILGAVGIYISFLDIKNFVYSIVFVHYALMLFILWQYINGGRAVDRRLIGRYLPVVVFAVVIQYLGGFTYSGIIFGYTAAGIFLPVSYILFKRSSPSKWPTMAALALFTILLSGGVYHRHDYMYRDMNRKHLIAEFSIEKMSGIKSTPRNVRQIEELVKSATYNTGPNDRIFIYPDFPALYYLADRRNATPVDWYYDGGFNDEMLSEVLISLKRSPSKMVFLQYFAERDYLRKGIRPRFMRKYDCYARLVDYIVKNYTEIKPVGDIFIFVPKN